MSARRLLVELGHAADPGIPREAAVLAHLLDAELHVVFVEDEALMRASGLSFTREISVLSCRWRPLDPARIQADLHAAANDLRARLDAAARQAGVRPGFEVHRGHPWARVTEIRAPDDIVVVGSGGHAWPEPGGSVLYLPPGPVRRHGPIAMAAGADQEQALAVARRIATRGHERLVTVEDFATESPDTAAGAFDDLGERLIVLSGGGYWAGMAGDLAERRGVPVLVVA